MVTYKVYPNKISSLITVCNNTGIKEVIGIGNMKNAYYISVSGTLMDGRDVRLLKPLSGRSSSSGMGASAISCFTYR